MNVSTTSNRHGQTFWGKFVVLHLLKGPVEGNTNDRQRRKRTEKSLAFCGIWTHNLLIMGNTLYSNKPKRSIASRLQRLSLFLLLQLFGQQGNIKWSFFSPILGPSLPSRGNNFLFVFGSCWIISLDRPIWRRRRRRRQRRRRRWRWRLCLTKTLLFLAPPPYWMIAGTRLRSERERKKKCSDYCFGIVFELFVLKHLHGCDDKC